MEEVEADLESPEEVTVERLEELGLAGLSVLLPLFYIYTWTAARSLFLKLGEQETVNSLSQYFTKYFHFKDLSSDLSYLPQYYNVSDEVL